MQTEQINILMVDDSPTNLLALQSIRSAPDRNLVNAASGDDALRYLLNHEVAVILMDVYMPGLDGLETAELIRGRDRSRDIPIIFLTADSTGGRHLSRGYSLGAVDYIVKPIEPDILRSKVAVFVELFKKTQEIKRQAQLLKEKNLELESANLTRLNKLIELGQELSSQRDPLQVLDTFCRSARQIVEAQEAAVGLIDNNGTVRYFFCCREGEENGAPPDNGIPKMLGRSLKRILKERRPLRLNDSDDLLRDRGKTSELVHSFLGAPILSGNSSSGWVYLLNKQNAEDFSEADERLAVTLSTQVGIAYENALLYSDAQQHATELQLEIAERKQAEEGRAQLLVRERTARAEAEQANRTKDEFLATLSHELRTPLTAILGWSHLVRTGNLEESQMTRAVETIERNARSQSQLIDDLLDVSRIITGKLEIEPVQVDLCTVIESAIEAVRPSFEAKEIHFKTVLNDNAHLVSGDANRLQQIFWNLFSNAVKFTPTNGTVRVELEKRNQQVCVAVSDSGTGITAEFLPYIFDRFRQADGSTTRVHGGLGLGLSIVKHLVQLHGGTVEVTSDGKDKGSTFIVTLPLLSNDVSVSREASTFEIGGNGVAAGLLRLLKGLRILVIDDEADSRDLVSAILTRYGSDVNCCESAAAGMEAFKSWKPDLLVSDIGMPVEDGYSLIKRLRRLKSKRAKEMPAIALTAYASQDDQERTLSAGFQIHVAKPIDPEKLIMSVAKVVGSKV